MFGWLKRWWNDGEDSDVLRVWKFDWRSLGVACGCVLGFPLVLGLASGRTVDVGFLFFDLVLALAMLLGVFCERRRAILVYENLLVYRPPFGPARAARWNRVRQAKRCIMFRERGIPEGLKFTLDNGSVFSFPIDLKQSPEVVEYVKAKLSDRACL
jgi:hypothetical protein